MGIDEIVRPDFAIEHVFKEGKSEGMIVLLRGIGSDDGSEEVDIGRLNMVEDSMSIMKIWEIDGTKTKEFESIEMGLGMTKCD